MFDCCIGMGPEVVFDCCIGHEHVVVVRPPAVHQPHTNTVTTGTKGRSSIKRGCHGTADAAVRLLHTALTSSPRG